jgi:hypothetical protein
MPEQMSFQQTEQELMSMQFNSLTERNILKFWRTHEPKKVEDMLSKGILRKTLTLTADAILDMQMALQESENLPPSLARMEAWNRLMRIEEDEVEEAEAFGMTLDEYRNRPF